MQTDYLFLIPLTPTAMLDARRSALRKLCFRQLDMLNCTYNVWLLGEGKRVGDLAEHFKLVNTGGNSKEDKLFEAGNLLEGSSEERFRNLVRLDDDDLINPEVFDAYAKKDVDCCVDRLHWFYDLSSGRLSRQKRDWFPNTIIHSFGHAMTKVEAIGGSEKAGSENYLFACDHSLAWKAYYENRNVEWVNSENPLYIRVLNPGSITASAKETGDEVDYFTYLTTFGDWNAEFPMENKQLKRDLIQIWTDEFGELRRYKFPNKTLLTKIIERIRK